MTDETRGGTPALFRKDLRLRVERFAGTPLNHDVVGPRSQSYDHCYNYFAANTRPTADLEKSCAVLGFYLASWGMYRGSTYLFKNTSSQHFVPLIGYIEQHAEAMRRIDVDGYDPQRIDLLMNSYSQIRQFVLPDRHAALTLVTKIMAGVFGCVPALDTYFMKGIRSLLSSRDATAFGSFSARSLRLLNAFYLDNKQEVDGLAHELRTVQFPGGSPGGLHLTRAKVIDMYGFELGYRPSWVPTSQGVHPDPG